MRHYKPAFADDKEAVVENTGLGSMNTGFRKAFRERFQEPRETTKDRQRVYLPYVESLKKVYQDCRAVDLGCGRGEWLELLAEIGVDGRGVDLDDEVLEDCRRLGLKIEKGDLLGLLRSLPDESQVVVSGFHIAEHLAFTDLQQLVQESLRVLCPAGILILETPNPENLTVGTAGFYLDPTHLRPIPPPLLAFLPEFYGFHETRILRLQEVSELSEKNGTRLYDALSGASPDYAVVAQKSAEPSVLAMFGRQVELGNGLTLDALVSRYDARADDKARGMAPVRAERDGIPAQVENLLTRLNEKEAFLLEVNRRFTNLLEDHKLALTASVALQSGLETARKDCKDLRNYAENLSLRLEQTRQQMNAACAAAQRFERDYAVALSSHSYRITAPLRAVHALLLKLRKSCFPQAPRPEQGAGTVQQPPFPAALGTIALPSAEENYFYKLFRKPPKRKT